MSSRADLPDTALDLGATDSLAHMLPPLLLASGSALLLATIASGAPAAPTAPTAPPAPQAPPAMSNGTGPPASSPYPAGYPELAATAKWVAPVASPFHVTRKFEHANPNWLPGHRGVDFAAEVGAAVYAASPGTITWASSIVGRGVVVVSHAAGLRTTYEPVTAAVSVGDQVLAGQLIGWVTPGTGHCGGYLTCLHWGLRRGFDYLNPLALIDQRRAVLVPLSG